MRLASLYSGGKDSTFSLYLAEQMGHEVPYLVNIVPDDEASWIFHTPNLGIVPLMAESMGKDLVSLPAARARRRATWSASGTLSRASTWTGS